MSLLRLDDRPRPVRLAVYLLLVGSCVGLVLRLVRAAVSHGPTSSGALIAAGIGWVVSVAVVLAVAYGRRWALTLYLLFVAWAVVSFPVELSVHPARGHAALAWDASTLVVCATAAILLLLPESRRWFAASAAAHGGRPAAS